MADATSELLCSSWWVWSHNFMHLCPGSFRIHLLERKKKKMLVAKHFNWDTFIKWKWYIYRPPGHLSLLYLSNTSDSRIPLPLQFSDGLSALNYTVRSEGLRGKVNLFKSHLKQSRVLLSAILHSELFPQTLGVKLLSPPTYIFQYRTKASFSPCRG